MTDFLDRLETALGDRYRIARELPRGGMAVVYLAHDQKHDRPVALKVLRPDLATSIGAERFLREMDVAAKLTHPNILTPYDCGDADGLLYYVMPFVEGESLRQRLEHKTQLAMEEALEITRQVAAALDHAHRQGIVHRDIRPENILLQKAQAVVVDFGIARALRVAGGERLAETGPSLETAPYMSPELVLGDKVDARSDLYSFGATLFELVTGQKPFDGETVQEIVAQHIANPVREPREVEPGVPASVSDAIVLCLQKAPKDRFQSAAEVLEAFETASASSDGRGSVAAQDIGIPEIVQGSAWDFDETFAPELEPPPQPVYEAGPVEESAPAPEPEPPPPPLEPIGPSADVIRGGLLDMGEMVSAAKPASSAPPPTTAESTESSAEPSEVVAATGDVVDVETETTIEAELAEPAPVKEVVRSHLHRLLMLAYNSGPELLVRLARQRETWYYVAGGVGVVLGVVLLWLAVRAVFFGPPNLHYQFIRNALVEPVQILVDGQMVHTLQPGQQDSMVLPKGRPVEVSWRLIPPRQGSEKMGQVFSAVLSTGVRRGKDTHSVITGVTPDRAMFAPRITNRTNRELVALINPGTPAETRCNCVIPSSSRNLHVGYYPLLENSTIRFFDARRAYSGRYQEIGDISARVDTLSGSVGLTLEMR